MCFQFATVKHLVGHTKTVAQIILVTVNINGS